MGHPCIVPVLYKTMSFFFQSVPVDNAKEIEETNAEEIKIGRVSSTIEQVSNSNGTSSLGIHFASIPSQTSNLFMYHEDLLVHN